MSTTKDQLVANYRCEVERKGFSVEIDSVKCQFVRDLDEAERLAGADRYHRIGTSESFNNKNEMQLSRLIQEHGSEVGATLVIFEITPGKWRAAKRGPDGRIDIEALRADPPVALSPSGYFLLRTRYFARFD